MCKWGGQKNRKRKIGKKEWTVKWFTNLCCERINFNYCHIVFKCIYTSPPNTIKDWWEKKSDPISDLNHKIIRNREIISDKEFDRRSVERKLLF